MSSWRSRRSKSMPITMAMDRTELAWAAGFWDGEGSAYLTGALTRSRQYPQGRINQSGASGIPAVLTRFRAAIGFGVISGPQLKEGREPLYQWVVSNRPELCSLLALLGPWLGEVKRRQLVDVLGMPSEWTRAKNWQKDEARAWAAGLFDGEGSVYLAKHRTHLGYFRLETAITQADPDRIPLVLTRFQEVVGIGHIYGPHPVPPGHHPVYRWKACRAAQVISMIDLVGPWLGEVKREQARSAIAVVDAQPILPRGNPAWGNRKTHCVNGHDYATARIRPFKGRGKNTEAPRPSHQCLACVREHARRKTDRKSKSAGKPVTP